MHIQNFDPYDFSKKEIAGVPVYYKNLPWAPCVHIRIVFNVGAYNDPVGKEGLAHFLEHMLFDGCPSMPDRKAIKSFKKEFTLGSLNASTNPHRTAYTARCLPEHLDTVLIGMKDMIFSSFVRPEDVEHQRSVITQEAWMYFKNEKYLAYKKEVTNNLFSNHERSRNPNTLGWPETIATMQTSDLQSFYSTYYVRENMRIVITGALTEQDLITIEKFLSDIPSGTVLSPIDAGTISKPLLSETIKQSDDIGDPQKQLEFTFKRISAPWTEWEENVHWKAHVLLADLLHERLRDENSLCYGVSVGTYATRDYSAFYINVSTSEEKKDIASQEIHKAINEVIEGLHEKKFNVAQKLILENIRSEERDSHDITSHAVASLVKKGSITTLADTIHSIEKVSYDDVREALRKTLDPEFCFTEIILPSKNTA